MGKVKPSAPPVPMAEPAVPAGTATGGNIPQPNATPYQSATAEFIGAAAEGQTIYIRAVHRTLLHRFSLFIATLTIIGAVGLALGQLWGMMIKNMVLMETIMRSYLMAVAGMVICNELEISSVLKASPIIQRYPWRGIFYTFLGSLGTLLNDLGNDDYINNWNRNYNRNKNYYNGGYVTFSIPSLEHAVEIFIGVTSRLLFCMGCIYFVMGLMFLQNKIERDVEAFRHRLRLADKSFGGHKDVLQRRVGGRLAEEMGMTHVV